MYTDTGLYSCIGVEIGGQPLGTTIANMEARGRTFGLVCHGCLASCIVFDLFLIFSQLFVCLLSFTLQDVFAGMIIARADNQEIDSIEDIKDKVIAAVSISDFAGAEVQFFTMLENGLDYIMDPKQVIFTGKFLSISLREPSFCMVNFDLTKNLESLTNPFSENQNEIITGVLEGKWDVGFVRTGLIEQTRDKKGKLLDESDFKILEPNIYVMDTGELFPFMHSTPIFPEWPIFAMDGVDRSVTEEVILALINFEYHKVCTKRLPFFTSFLMFVLLN
jgi:hypothetical protein